MFKRAMGVMLSVAMLSSSISGSMGVLAAEYPGYGDTAAATEEYAAEEEIVEQPEESVEYGDPSDEVSDGEEEQDEESGSAADSGTYEEAAPEDETDFENTDENSDVSDNEEEDASEAATDQETDTMEEAETDVRNVPTFDHEYAFDGSYDGQDFSSCRLLIATEDESIFTWDTVILSFYNGIYLAQFGDETETMNAYSYYYSLADFVEADMEFEVAANEQDTDELSTETEELSEETGSEESMPAEAGDDMPDTEGMLDDEEVTDPLADENINNNDDAISNLNSLAETVEPADSGKMTVALIDTGIPEDASYIEAVSLISDYYTDDNGHGTDMYRFMTEEDPDIEIVSIKALDENGKGSVSDLYAAIEYAIAKDADIINLSVSAYLTEGSEVINRAVSDAYDAGKIVVGAAGNNGRNAKYFIPGSIGQAYIVGACDEKGVRLNRSNYGETVDYNVVAESTSEAAARLSGFISKNGEEGIADVLDKEKIFSTDYVPKDEPAPEVTTNEVETAAAEPHPGADWTYNGTIDSTPSYIDVIGEINVNYTSSNAQYSNSGLNYTGVLRIKDQLGNEAFALCVDPYAWGFSTGDHRTAVDVVKSNNIIKALYYGQGTSTSTGDYKFGRNWASEIGGSVQAGFVLSHIAASYYALGNKSYMFGEAMKLETQRTFWGNCSAKLQTDVVAYMNKLATLPTPQNVSCYVVYPRPNHMLGGGQAYVYLTNSKEVKVKLTKRSSNTVLTDEFQGSYKLWEGGTFGLYTDAAATQLAKTRSGADAILRPTVKTTENGSVVAVTGTELLLNKGTYYFKEITPPTGYAPRSNIVTVSANTVGGTNSLAYNDTPATGGNISIRKTDSVTGESIPEGTVFRVRLYDGYYSRTYFEPDNQNPTVTPKRTWYIRTINGEAKLDRTYADGDHTSDAFYDAGKFPLGTYLIDEVTVPDGYVDTMQYGRSDRANYYYQFSDGTQTNYASKYRSIHAYLRAVGTTTGQLQDSLNREIKDEAFVCTNVPIVGGVKIAKKDSTTNVAGDTVGDGTLEGAQFEIVNNNSFPVYKDRDPGTLYAQGEVITTITTGADGTAATSNICLPKGSYILRESVAPAGYVLDSTTTKTFTITDNEEVLDLSGAADAFGDKPIRGNFKFKKTDETTGNAMANVQFRVTNNTTGESHTIRTNASGEFNSATVSHSHDTNGGTAASGLWFGRTNMGNNVAADDSMGALPYGSYTLEEIEDSNNTGYIMVTKTFQISENSTTVDLGTITNKRLTTPNVTTELTGNGRHYVTESSNVLQDVVNYTGFGSYVGRSIKFRSVLKNKSAGTVVSEKETTVNIGNANGTFTVQFDALGSDVMANAGDLVAFEYAYDGTTLIASHEDMNDVLQTVHIPRISTTAVNAADSSKTVVADGTHQITVKDTVNYTNFEPGKQYVVKTVFYDVAEISTKAEAQCTPILSKTQTFTSSTTGNGTWNVTIPGTIPAETSDRIVAYETVYLSDGTTVYATHKDKNSVPQQLRCPKITTDAKDPATGLRTISVGNGGSVTIRDDVIYEGLETGREYKLVGQLVDKTTGNTIGEPSEATFTATAEDGTAVNNISAAAGDVSGKTIVIYEVLYDKARNVPVAYHEDINDASQTVSVPSISTEAASKSKGGHFLGVSNGEVIKDVMSYSGFAPSSSVQYKIIGGVLDKSTGQEIPSQMVNSSGANISSTTFKATSASGTADVYYKVNTTDLKGKQLVVYERIYYAKTGGDILVAEHRDINDMAQTVSVPGITTNAEDDGTESHTGLFQRADNNVIKDEVSIVGLIPGRTYKLTGKLMKKTAGTPTEIPSTIISAETDMTGTTVSRTDSEVTFTPSETSGTVTVSFKYDATGLTGESVVVYESLFCDTELIAKHEDIDDEDQTIHFPDGRTVAQSEGGAAKYILPRADQFIEDTFYYENLIPGETYVLKGKIMVKGATAAATVEHNSYSMVNSAGAVINGLEFTPDSADGSVKLRFKVDASALAGRSIVVYEDLMYGTDTVVRHEDFNDADQTVFVPAMSTLASEKATGDKFVKAQSGQVIKDVMSYSGLCPDGTKTYKVIGGILDKSTGNPVSSQMVNASGQNISFTTFTSSTGQGTVDVYYKVDASQFKGKQLVAFERIYEQAPGGDKLIAEHVDANDTNQTVYVPGVATNAVDKQTGTHAGSVQTAGNNYIVDAVTYTGLVPGRTYKLTGALMKKGGSTPSEIPSTVTAATAAAGTTTSLSHTAGEVTFVPAQASGVINVEFRYDASSLTGGAVVVYEDIYCGSNIIAEHHDINDRAQTVSFTNGYTVAKSEGGADKYILPRTNQYIEDTFYYENLTPGTEYTIVGRLMVKGTSAASTVEHSAYHMVNDAGADISGKTFTPASESGSVKVRFRVNASGQAGKKIVVYEKIFKGSTLIVSHENFDDEDQTVNIPSMSTLATGSDTGTHVTGAGSGKIFKDVVSYSNFAADGTATYKVVGGILDKGTGQEVPSTMVTSEGTPVSKTTFTAASENGTVNVYYKVDTTGLKGRQLVAFERIYLENGNTDVLVAEHYDVNDANQTVYVPGMSTMASSKENGGKYISAEEGQVIKDVMSYTNFGTDTDTTYKIVGGILDKSTGNPVPSQMVTASGADASKTTFKAAAGGSGTVDVYYKVDGSALTGKQLVAYERVYIEKPGGDVLVAEHYDVNDANQTVNVPGITTNAVDKQTATHTASVQTAGNNIVVDAVTYTGLIPGQVYRIRGKLMKKGLLLPEEVSSEITAATAAAGTTTRLSFTADEVTFTPTQASGVINISFKYDAVSQKGKSVVVYEDLYSGTTLIADHHDIDDEDQTVSIPDGRTVAKGTNGTEDHIFPAPDQYIEDTFYYENLVPGAEYTLVGKLMVKGETAAATVEHGSYSMVNELDETITGLTFTPQSKDGSVKLKFKIDASGVVGKSIVAYETLRSNNVAVVIHEDFSDTDQTVAVLEGKATLKKTDPDTGANVQGAVYGVYKQSDDSLVKQLDPTGADGTVVATGLAVGDYYFKEITPPADYEINDAKIMFSITTASISTGLPDTVHGDTTDEHKKAKFILKKTINDANPDTTKEFKFDIELGHATLPKLNVTYTGVRKSGPTTTELPIKFTDGKAQVSLKHGETIEVSLPTTYTYKITEVADAGYVVEAPATGKYEGTVTEGQTVTAAFTNKAVVSTGLLTVKKTVTGNLGSRDKEFDFTMTLKTAADAVYTTPVSYTKGTETGTLTPDAAGKVTFKLAHDEQITFTDLTIGTKYVVTEADYSSESYSTVSENASGTIALQNPDVKFTNSKGVQVPTGIFGNGTTGFGFLLAGISLTAIAGILFRRKRYL